jgi:transcriptional regulator with GAF, ATPase, and Fis domain
VRRNSREAETFSSSESDVTLNSTYEGEIRQFKRRLILRALRQHRWNKVESARSLGVTRGYLHRLINQLEISQFEEDSLLLNMEETHPRPERVS